jgi:hypothetical protein
MDEQLAAEWMNLSKCSAKELLKGVSSKTRGQFLKELFDKVNGYAKKSN